MLDRLAAWPREIKILDMTSNMHDRRQWRSMTSTVIQHGLQLVKPFIVPEKCLQNCYKYKYYKFYEMNPQN